MVIWNGLLMNDDWKVLKVLLDFCWFELYFIAWTYLIGAIYIEN